MRSPRNLLVLAGAFAVLMAACGGAGGTGGDSGTATRTIEVEMVDIAFAPDTVEVAAGETVRFVFINRGEVPHDAHVGDAAAQAVHEAEMREGHGGGHGGHGDDEGTRAVTVGPGERAELTHTFDELGTVEIGCHQPGHYEAGMKIMIEVE